MPGKEVPVYADDPGAGRSSRLNSAASVPELLVSVSGASVVSEALEPSESVGELAPDCKVSSQAV